MKIEKFKTKDFVFLGIIAALYTILFFISGVVSGFLPGVAHALTPAFVALTFGGVVVVFLLSKLPKFGVLTLLSFVQMLVFTLLGMGYLPWFLAVMIGSLLADFIAHSSNYKSKFKNALAYGLVLLGHSAGGILPIWFFLESFKQTWLEKGMTIEQIQPSIDAAAGYIGVFVLLTSFFGGFFGIYIGYKILAKHFKKQIR